VVSILNSYNVDSPEYGKPLKIDVVEGLDNVHLDYIEQQWQPLLKRQYQSALLQYFTLPPTLQTEDAFRAILGNLGIPDEHWDWRKKCTYAPATNRKVYSLLNGEHVEAVMVLLFGRNARCGAPNLPLVYVDFVASAPWNRTAIQRPERFHGMGTMMLGAALAVSRMHGLDGRCGLHSLASAEGFYRRIGMKEFDMDPSYHDMRYFEFDSQTARAFTG
jgi:hypothetical protein